MWLKQGIEAWLWDKKHIVLVKESLGKKPLKFYKNQMIYDMLSKNAGLRKLFSNKTKTCASFLWLFVGTLSNGVL